MGSKGIDEDGAPKKSRWGWGRSTTKKATPPIEEKKEDNETKDINDSEVDANNENNNDSAPVESFWTENGTESTDNAENGTESTDNDNTPVESTENEKPKKSGWGWGWKKAAPPVEDKKEV